MKRIALHLSLFSILLLSIQCDKETSKNAGADVKGSAKSLPASEVVEPEIKMNYTAFTLPKGKKDSAIGAFTEKYSAEEQYTILALNRLDAKNRWRADTLVVPEKIETDFLMYAPFPKRLEVLEPVKKIIFFSYAIHAFGVYENGQLKKWGPTSLGTKKSPTKTGLTFTNWKSKMATSTVDPSWKLGWNFNIYNTLGIGWHQYDLPGFHASHSCLRLLEEDAKYLYSWADQWQLSADGSTVAAKGTPVFVFGESDFKTKPWYALLKDGKANDFTEAQMTEIIQPSLSKILDEQKISDEKRNLIAQVSTPAGKSNPQILR